MSTNEQTREYLCMAIPDTASNDYFSQNENRVCRTTLFVRRESSFHTLKSDHCCTLPFHRQSLVDNDRLSIE